MLCLYLKSKFIDFHFRLPPFIILYIQRFTKNTFYVEKNPTIVNFPIKSIEFGDFLTDEAKKRYPNGAPYDLIANVVHEGAPTSGTYKLHILHKGKFYLGHISNRDGNWGAPA